VCNCTHVIIVIVSELAPTVARELCIFFYPTQNVKRNAVKTNAMHFLPVLFQKHPATTPYA
jgi:hypothetical protein